MSILAVTLNPSVDRVLAGDHLRPDDIMRTRLVMEYAGGKGNNAARALSRLGVRATVCGFQGGQTGEKASRLLASEGLATSLVRSVGPTRISTMLHEEDTGLTYAIYEPGQEITPQELADLMHVFSLLVGSQERVLLCGSAQTPLLHSAYRDMASLAAARAVPVMLDSSGVALRLAVSARPDVVKVNEDELQALLQRPLADRSAQAEALLELCRMGIHIAALSLGRDGLLATDGAELWHGRLTMNPVINTVGCGDSALAGMAYALAASTTLADVVRWGTASGAANTRVWGAGFITGDSVRALLPAVQLTRIS